MIEDYIKMKLLENIKGNFYFSYSQPIEFIENTYKKNYENEVFIEIYKGMGKDKYRNRFLNYTGNPNFNYVYEFKADISANDIIIDFTKIPKKYQKYFFYIHQNEVIVKNKKINAKIADIDISEKFNNWLINNGFLFKNNIGIIKI